MEDNNQNDKFKSNWEKLDDSQFAAASADDEEVVIRASAGSGKTSTLITSIANYRYNHVNDRICAITYTRAARAEMENRLREMGIFDVEVTTIHVWSRNLLQEFSMKYNFKVEILQEPRIKDILEEIVTEYIRHSRVRSVNIGILYNYIMGNKTMDITDNYRRTLNALEARYINYKRNLGLYDFTDYPLYLWNVMTIYKEYINNIDALFVDEFQDVDEIQFRIFDRVNSNKKFFIGDPWQSIFIFRGADGEVFNKLGKFKNFKLKYNYRSYQEIIDYATFAYLDLRDIVENGDEECFVSESISHLYDDSVDDFLSRDEMGISFPQSKISCSKGYGGTIYTISPYGETYTLTHHDMSISYDSYYKLIDEFLSASNSMILCRTNKQVKAVQEAGILNVSTVHQAKGLEYDNVLVIDHEIRSTEDLNIAYVALTRARNEMLVINWTQFYLYLKNKKNEADRHHSSSCLNLF